MSKQPVSIPLRRRLELDLHTDEYARLERAARLEDLSIEEFLCMAASRCVTEALPPRQPTEWKKRKLELAMHPDDYARVERAAQAVGYTIEEFSRLSLHLQSTGILERTGKRSSLGDATGMVHEVSSWVTTTSTAPYDCRNAKLRRAAEATNVGAPHE